MRRGGVLDTTEELLCHCHRNTRGAEVTLQLIKELLMSLSTATNSLGVPFWCIDGHHLGGGEEACKMHSGSFWDDPVCHYRAHHQGWGEAASVSMCKRHLPGIFPHFNLARLLYQYYLFASKSFFIRFIPGTTANNLHYQGFLLEGLAGWNQARALAALQQQDCQLRTFNFQAGL